MKSSTKQGFHELKSNNSTSTMSWGFGLPPPNGLPPPPPGGMMAGGMLQPQLQRYHPGHPRGPHLRQAGPGLDAVAVCCAGVIRQLAAPGGASGPPGSASFVRFAAVTTAACSAFRVPSLGALGLAPAEVPVLSLLFRLEQTVDVRHFPAQFSPF